MAIASRSTYIFGPAKFSLAAFSDGSVANWFTQGDETVEIKPVIELAEQRIYGQLLDRYVTDEMVQASVPIDNRLDANRVKAFWPYAATQAGVPIFTATDRAFVATDRDGRVYTVVSAGVTKMPSLNFSLTGQLIGSIDIEGLRGDTMATTDNSSLLTIVGSGGTFDDSTLSNDDFLHQPYTVTYGTDFVAIDTIDGVQIDFELELGTIKTQNLGTHQRYVKSVSWAAKFIPVGQAYDKILGLIPLQGANNKLGRSLDIGTPTSQTFSVAGVNTGRTHFSGSKGALHVGSYRFGLGDNTLRDGEVAVVSTRQLTAGVPQSLFTITP